MDKWTVARMLDEIANYIELSDANKFKARAFERAARAIENSETDVVDLVKTGDLYKTSGIGKAIGPIVVEIVETGASPYLDDLRKQYPPGVFDLLRVPTMTLKKVGAIHAALGISTVEELEEAARDGRIAKLKGFGAKTAEKILGGIEWARKNESRFLLPTGLEIGELLRERLAAIDEVDDADVAGSVRRRLEVITNVNVVISTRRPKKVLEEIGRRGVVDQFEPVDETTFKGLARGEMNVLLHLTKPEDFGAAMLRATGSAEFVEAFAAKIAGDGYELRGNALLHRGKHVAAENEHDLFERVGIAFVEPERREDASELARKKRVRLVQPADLRGTFHVHTTWSDGRNSVAEMLAASKERGFEYVGISDHSPNASYAGGLTVDRLREQQKELAAEEKNVAPMRVFRGTEADIMLDGSIDYGSKVLGSFDFVIASVHSRFSMPKDEMTERILTALDDPHVTFLGHMTGRKLLARDGYTFDYDRVFERAGQRAVMIEINGNPNRLDIDWRLIKRALDRGVIFSINPDAHSIRELSHVISGSWVARKAGLSAKEIFNSLPVEAVEEFFAARRAARAAR
jgi:DNA polymerase (family 10)